MRVARRKDGFFEARFSKTGWACFIKIIGLYPRVAPARHRLSRQTAEGDQSAAAAQALLEEAVAEQQIENKRALLRMLSDPARLKMIEKGFVLRLSEIDAYSLLQVLNDIRVGSWVALGSPEMCEMPPSESLRQDYYTMELAGHFESALIEALSPGD